MKKLKISKSELLQNEKDEFRMLTPVVIEDFRVDYNSHLKPSAKPDLSDYFSHIIDNIEKFAVGRYFWFIGNTVEGTIEHAGGMTDELIGYSLHELLHKSILKIFLRIHPNDLPKFYAFANYWISILINNGEDEKGHLHPTICVRLRNAEDLYKWVMIRYIEQYLDKDGNALYDIALVTDITHIKRDGPPMMCLLNTFDNNCKYFYCNEEKQLIIKHISLHHFTQRELEILKLLAAGKSSKQIAAELKISIKTVDNHRQNMLEKVNAKSSAELVSFGINGGFI